MRRYQVLAYSRKADVCLYVMTKSFRISNNYSLYEAIEHAKEYHLDLHILIIEPQEINKKSYDFYKQYQADLVEKLAFFSTHVHVIRRSDMRSYITHDIQTIFVDEAYLRADIMFNLHLKKLAMNMEVSLFTVESNVFVPVKVASHKLEYGAYTIRPKIHRLLYIYDRQVLLDAPISLGEQKANFRLQTFMKELDHYEEHNDPTKAYTSRLSVFLKFGMISPVTIYHALNGVDSPQKDVFLEEVIVRRELAYNFVYYNPNYDKFERITERWAYITMQDHQHDKRPYVYKREDYEQFNTHDPYVNAAMKQMIYTGYMHGYMRMYWAKKIIEWSSTYEEAYHITMTLNNKYFLDGFTPNGYCGVAWCYGKHDRAWKERPIFGKLRYMNENGLKRKFDIDLYVKQMTEIEKEFKR